MLVFPLGKVGLRPINVFYSFSATVFVCFVVCLSFQVCSVFVNDDICSMHSRLSTIITVNSMGVSGACACCVTYFGSCNNKYNNNNIITYNL